LRDQAKRKTGIDALGEMPWGTHFCHFYETKEDLLDVVVPFFKAGLENNEYCLWAVLYPLSVEDATNALQLAVPGADQHIAAGDIEIVQYSKWYLRDGRFDVERVIEASREKVAQALVKRYAGVRLSANESSPMRTDWKEFSQYELKLNRLLAGERMLVLCSYSLASATAAHAFEIARIHQFAVAKRRGRWELLKQT
jgi:hypothetical protein